MAEAADKIAQHIVRYSSLTTAELVRQVQLDRLSTTTRIQMLDEIARRDAQEAAASDPETTGEWDEADWREGGDGKVYAA